MIDKERFSALAQRYLDGELDDIEARELRAAIESSAELREQLRAQAAIHAVMTHRFKNRHGFVGRRVRAALRDPNQKKGAITRIMDKLSEKRPKKKEPPLRLVRKAEPHRSRRTFFLVAAALAVVLLGSPLIYKLISRMRANEAEDAAWKLPPDASPVARAKPDSGQATITRDGKTLTLKKERPVLAGDLIATAEAVALTLEYPDKSTVKIPADSKLLLQPAALKSEAGIAIELTKGEIEADVAAQPAGHPMIVITPHGRATIVGTRFKLAASPAQSKLEVLEGKVRFSSALKAESVLVEKGQSAVLMPGVPLEVAAATRDPALWPFSPESPWNTPLGSGAKFAPIDSPHFNPDNGPEVIMDAGAIPIYIATANDPQRVMYRNDKAKGKLLRIPLDAKPDPSEIKYMNVIDDRHFKVFELVGVQFEPDGTVNLGDNAYYNSIQHLGVYENNKTHGTRTFGGSSLGGIIRNGELSGGIRHALGVGVVISALNGNTPTGRPYVWPASTAAQAWETMYGHSGNLHLGTLLAIPPNVDIRKLGVGTSGPLFEIARAMQDYGAYIVDHSPNENHDLKLYFEPGQQAQIPNGFESRFSAIMRVLKVVANNSRDNVGGGGTPRRPPAPPFAKEFLDNQESTSERIEAPVEVPTVKIP